jgi:hypothetical protein
MSRGLFHETGTIPAENPRSVFLATELEMVTASGEDATDMDLKNTIDEVTLNSSINERCPCWRRAARSAVPSDVADPAAMAPRLASFTPRQIYRGCHEQSQ